MVSTILSRNVFNEIFEKAKKYKYSSMSYIDYDDCKYAEVLKNDDNFILLQDVSKTPAMLYFATNDFHSFIEIIPSLPGKLRLHFVPREFSAQLVKLGFKEWAEYTDFFNYSLGETAAKLGACHEIACHEIACHEIAYREIAYHEIAYLDRSECEEVSAVSKKCRLQSRGFEGESPEWFADWLNENKVIVQREDSSIAGYCCVSIYNKGTTLWIREIAVDPAYQGKGFGKKMMGQAICYGVQNGAEKGFLAADLLNRNAIGLYQKYNFNPKNEDSELQMIRE